eukprot:276720-Prorocentrum_minimum.AAC.1
MGLIELIGLLTGGVPARQAGRGVHVGRGADGVGGALRGRGVQPRVRGALEAAGGLVPPGGGGGRR